MSEFAEEQDLIGTLTRVVDRLGVGLDVTPLGDQRRHQECGEITAVLVKLMLSSGRSPETCVISMAVALGTLIGLCTSSAANADTTVNGVVEIVRENALLNQAAQEAEGTTKQ